MIQWCHRDGSSAWRQRPRLATILIVVASGSGSPFDSKPHKEQPWIAAVLRKPYDAEELMSSIESALALAAGEGTDG